MKAKALSQIETYRLTKTIGRGSMGKVKLAIDINSGQKLACKVIKDTLDLKEALVLSLLDHKHIVKLHLIRHLPPFRYLFFDLVNGAQMLDLIISHGKLKEKNARIYFRMLISAVDYLHLNSIVHRDLKIVLAFNLGKYFNRQGRFS